MLAGENTAQVGREVPGGHNVRSGDHQGVVITTAHHGGGDFEFLKVKSELNNLNRRTH